MDSSSSVRTLEPSKIYLPNCWNKFLVRLSNTHDLAEKSVLVNQAKLMLEKEAARLAASKLEPFSMAMELVTNAIISIDEEKKSVVQDMKKFQALGTNAYMSMGEGVAKEVTLQGRCFASGSNHEGEPRSGATLFDAEHCLTAEVTRNSINRKREFEEPINNARKRHGVCIQLDQEGPCLFTAPFSEQPADAHFANPPLRIRDSAIESSRAQFRPCPLDEVNCHCAHY